MSKKKFGLGFVPCGSFIFWALKVAHFFALFGAISRLESLEELQKRCFWCLIMVFYREQSKNSSGFGVLSSFDIPLLMYGAHTLGPLR